MCVDDRLIASVSVQPIEIVTASFLHHSRLDCLSSQSCNVGICKRFAPLLHTGRLDSATMVRVKVLSIAFDMCEGDSSAVGVTRVWRWLVLPDIAR